MASKAIDRANEFNGTEHEGWGVGKPVVAHGGHVYLQFAKRRCQNANSRSCPGPYVPMQNFVIVSDNMATERDADQLRFDTLPHTDVGLSTAGCDLAEEGDVVPLEPEGSGDLAFYMRSYDGFVGAARYYAHNDTWVDRLRAVYRRQLPSGIPARATAAMAAGWSGAVAGAPRSREADSAAWPLRYLKNVNGPLSPRRVQVPCPWLGPAYGSGTSGNGTCTAYLLLYYNAALPPTRAADPAAWGARNPYWLAAGWPADRNDEGVAGADGVVWSEPEIACYQHGQPEARLGYPDLFRTAEGGWYMTETDKVSARLHALPASLVQGLVQQRWYAKAREANITHTFAAPVPASVASPPVGLFNLSSFTLDVHVAPVYVMARGTEETVASVDCQQEGRGVALAVFANGSVVADLSDGVTSVRLQRSLSPKQANSLLPSHVALISDAQACVAYLVVDGMFVDGSAESAAGFYFDPTGGQQLGSLLGAPACQTHGLQQLRYYDVAIGTSAAVGNAVAGPGA